MRNIRFAFRTLFKAPFVTAVAIISLALGIGANTAIFSVFDQMLLRPLPVSDPVTLVNLGAPGPKPGSQSSNNSGNSDATFSYPMFRDLEKVQTVFSGLAAHRIFGANLSFQGQTENQDAAMVSGTYFSVLGLSPAAGRLLGPADDQAIGQSAVVVLAYDYWRDKFGARADALNGTMIINGTPMQIVGVAPAGFTGTTLGSQPKVFVPITMRGQMEVTFKGFDRRNSYWAYLFARLKPGVSIDTARTALNQQYSAIVNNVEAPLQTGLSPATLARFKAKPLTLEPGQRGQSAVHREAGLPIKILFGVTGVVLLIACANIANLLLARSASRSAEMAVRLSIGANRGHLIRQLLTEACLLGLMGGIAGLLVAKWTLVLLTLQLPSEAAATINTTLDWKVMAFAAALSLGTGVLFGLFPALHSTRPDLAITLKNQAGQPAGARSAAMFRFALVTAQITLSTALLAAAGLFAKSLYNIAQVDLGIGVEQLATFEISPRMNGYTPERSRLFFGQLEESLASLPGVTGVGAALVPLIAGDNWSNNVTVEGFKAGPDTDTNSQFNAVSPGFFQTVGIPLLAGREFTAGDVVGAPKVAIVNEAFAKKFNMGRNVVGKRFALGSGDVKLDTEIVGLVRNSAYSDAKRTDLPVFYQPYRQDPSIGDITFYVKSRNLPEQILSLLTPVVRAHDANLPISNLRTMTQQVTERTGQDRAIGTMAAAFAGVATLLAAIGLYGVLAYTVSRRTREFGLRMALGAQPGRVRAMVLRQVGWMTLTGGVIGIGLACAIGWSAQALLFGLQGWDPIVMVAAFVVLAIVAFGAGLVPALRASRIDPMRALRWQ